MKKIIACLFPIALIGCAKSSGEIRPSYVSPLQYQSYDCQQIGAEAQRVSLRANELAGVQDDKRDQDALATGAAIVIFWPAAFFVGGDGQTASELARLKGEFEALEQAGIQKKCGIAVKGKDKPKRADS
jgi:hypothetical protein